jgi:NAD(P)-dependent dehydrogenase (short-subunit alcohol dehydrogenase family)
VAAVDIDIERARVTADAIRGQGAEGFAIQCDVSSSPEVDAAVGEAVEKLSRIHVLVNNAGITDRRPVQTMPDSVWNRTLGVNLDGVFYFCRAVARIMVTQGGGSIINMASIGGLIGLPGGNAAYGASKGGVISLTRTLAVELAEYNIRVNALAPCQFRTPLISEIMEDPDRRRQILESIPLGRIGEPDELVGPVVFLASQASSMVTGHVLNVDGGMVSK